MKIVVSHVSRDLLELRNAKLVRIESEAGMGVNRIADPTLTRVVH